MKNKINIKLLILFSLMGIVGLNNLYSQDEVLKTGKIKGLLVDQNDIPIANAAIKAFYSKGITSSNNDGSFEIEVASDRVEKLIFDILDFEYKVVSVPNGTELSEAIKLDKVNKVDGSAIVHLPFKNMSNSRNVSPIYSVSGKDLLAYPSASFLDALAGLMPGVVVTKSGSQPGDEENSTYVSIRGEAAIIYIDGVIRDPYDLSAEEVEKVEVLKDLSSRATLGLYGSNPVLWIITKSGQKYNRQVNVSMEYGMNEPTVLPEYLNSFDYATLANEALVNDGLTPYYSDEALDAYKNNSNPVRYPNINYVDQYVKPSSPFRRANINFSGGDEKVNYFTMFSYVGSEGMEAVGEKYNSDRFKLRGNVNVVLNDYIQMNVNLSGTYRTVRSPNTDIFGLIAYMPANAHPTMFDDKYIVSNDYGVNIENSLVHSGYNLNALLGTQNNVKVDFDLSELLKGLSASATVAFDASSNMVNGKYPSEALYRMVESANGGDSTELVREKEVMVNLDYVESRSTIRRKTIANVVLNYDRTFKKHSLLANLAYYQGMFEQKSYSNYQPEKMQDLSFRANYSYDDKYIVQLDAVYSGSMRLPAGDKFSFYPTIGLGWVLSNENFLKDKKAINFLKLSGSLGIIGSNQFSLDGYNSYFLYNTYWTPGSSWRTGAFGTFATTNPSFVILQEGTNSFELPKKQIANIGLQGSMFDNSLAFDVNYYRNRNYDLISQTSNFIPSVFGSGQFLPATNFGEYVQYGFDGMIQYTKNIGDLNVTVGANALYSRGRYVVVDEPVAEAGYRKLAGKDIDGIMTYNALGLFQSTDEIEASTVSQIWGDLKPGDIRYEDYNKDDVIDEKDRYFTGDHFPRIYYGLNLKLAYKGIGLLVTGQGIADGKRFINGSYVVTTGSGQNYSKNMLDRWPVTNDLPRLTTTSQNNVQNSTFWLVNAASFRVKNVELSYTIPETVSEKIGASNLRLFARGSNLFTSSEVSKLGMDTESMYAGTQMYPIYKTISFGLSCKF